MLTNALGRAHLAFCPAAEREALLEILTRSTREEDRLAKNRLEVQKLINEARAQGYAWSVRARRVAEEMSIAVPVIADDRVLAAIAVRFSTAAIAPKLAPGRFVPRLADTAQRIRQQFLDQQRAGVPGQQRLPLARSTGTGE